MSKITWVTFTKRTDYPKLGYLIYRLRNAGIKCRIEKHSFHAPILEVPEADSEMADSILMESVTLAGKPSTPRRTKTTLDHLDDDHTIFQPYAEEQPE